MKQGRDNFIALTLKLQQVEQQRGETANSFMGTVYIYICVFCLLCWPANNTKLTKAIYSKTSICLFKALVAGIDCAISQSLDKQFLLNWTALT